jgi:ElaB/YqjD/DUF883 family membrane-anchored ribosome-binding protein
MHMSDSAELRELTAQVEDLLGKMGSIQTPEVQALRDRVNQAISSAKSAMSDAGEGAADAIKNALVSADDYVHQNPWIAVGVVAGIAGAVGFLAGLVATPKPRHFWN